MQKKYQKYAACLVLLFCISCESIQKETKKETNTDSISQRDEKKVAKNYQKIICIGNTITDIVRQMGLAEKIIAYDQALPQDTAFKRPKVGYGASLRAEHLRTHQPDLVLSWAKDSPEEIVNLMKGEKVAYELFEEPQNFEDLLKLLQSVGTILNKNKEAEQLVNQLKEEMQTLKNKTAKIKQPIRLLYIKASTAESILMLGKNTPIHAILTYAGCINAGDSWDEITQLNDENLAIAEPTFLIMSTKSAEIAYKNPAFLALNIVKTGRVITIPEYKMNMSLQTPKVAQEIYKKVYGQ
ncbi:MAG: hypothetical protein EAZ55_05520 [Cytophagales bacterium]|nr:MAG: hypothetical protein EAZ55_05520 [Cytophagales bacterium]